MKKIFLLLSMLTGSFFGRAQGTWMRSASLPVPRYFAAFFAIGTTGYVCTGRDGSSTLTFYNDLWAYDAITNTWSQRANFPGRARVQALGLAIGGVGYVGTGLDRTTYLADWYAYDPVTNAWSQRADLPGGGRDQAFGFSLNGKGYVGGGTGHSDFWEYDPAADHWSAKASYGGGINHSSAGFVVAGQGYVAGGIDGMGGSSNQHWCYDAAADRWTRRANLPAGFWGYSPGLELSGHGYIYGIKFANISPWLLEYNPVLDTWDSEAMPFADRRQGLIGFVLNGYAYMGSGIGVASPVGEMWQYHPTPTGLPFPFPVSALTCWPNPTTGLLHVAGAPFETASLYDALGRLVRTLPLMRALTTVDLSDLTPGTYLLSLGSTTRRVVIE